MNGLSIEAPEEDVVLTMVGVADGSIQEKKLTDWLGLVCKKY